MSDPAYKLSLSTSPPSQEPLLSPSPRPSVNPSVNIHFACCGIYTRIYRSADGRAYRGRCPRCGLPVNFRVSPDGTESRFFVVH